VTAVPISQGMAPNGFGPLPVILAPGKAVTLHIAVTPPQAPGIYTFAFSLMADHVQLPFLPAGSSFLIAPVAHKFTGAACLTPPMQQQIPPQVPPGSSSSVRRACLSYPPQC
jgi:hypothetical protein